ncbi:MAG: diacylglycerol kinase [Solirubrobacterales bacterium]|nr:diacylglycerol kinase [Solirubrobacterales bacterium]
MKHSVGNKERIAAISSLVLGLVAIVLAVELAIERFPHGLIVIFFLLVSVGLAGLGLIASGLARIAAFCAAAVLFGFTIGALVEDFRNLIQALGVVAVLLLAVAMARIAFGVRVPLPDAPRPERPVLFFNPKSGGGKAERFDLDSEARARGYETVELRPGDDLGELVREAVERGADGLAMAGGDGSQAVVAAIAAEHDLPYACVPAGTRNHFALDLGVDREDCVGALDAFVEAGERLVDLAEVNGRVFVNNVSLGIYAEAVQKDEYREAKIKTLLDTVPQVLGPEADVPELSWVSPSGRRHRSGAAILVSNNRYRLGKAVGSGTRPKIDDGELGIAVLADPVSAGKRLKSLQKPWRDWSAPEFEVGADHPVAAGIDGEAARLDPPLEFSIRPGALRVRVARQHPGASPSAAIPDGPFREIVALARIAAGRPPSDGAVVQARGTGRG